MIPKQVNFLAIGECMLEVAPFGADQVYHLGIAGDTLNTAWYLRHLRPNWDVSYMTRIGADRTSKTVVDFLIGTGIGIDQVLSHPSRSIGLYLVQLTDGERSFSYWRDNSAARELLEDPERIRTGVAAADVLYFSGITSAILGGNQREAFYSILAEAGKNGAQVVFDPNLRPKLWADENIMCDSIMRAAAVSSIAFPSFEDEADHFGDPTPLATCERYLNAGCCTVIVKNGPNKISYSHNGEVGIFQPDRVDMVLDTTAAGDSFNAGFLSEFLKSGDIRQALNCATKLAARVIQGSGALVQSAVGPNWP